jgi:hypothetical protein
MVIWLINFARDLKNSSIFAEIFFSIMANRRITKNIALNHINKTKE